MPQTYFGERWDSPAFEDAVEIPTPVDAECLLCHEIFVEGDDGLIMKESEHGMLRDKPVHLSCYLRAVLGSPAHLRGECTCAGGTDDHHGDSRPYRVQAEETLQILRDGGAYWMKAEDAVFG